MWFGGSGLPIRLESNRPLGPEPIAQVSQILTQDSFTVNHDYVARTHARFDYYSCHRNTRGPSSEHADHRVSHLLPYYLQSVHQTSTYSRPGPLLIITPDRNPHVRPRPIKHLETPQCTA